MAVVGRRRPYATMSNKMITPAGAQKHGGECITSGRYKKGMPVASRVSAIVRYTVEG